MYIAQTWMVQFLETSTQSGVQEGQIQTPWDVIAYMIL